MFGQAEVFLVLLPESRLRSRKRRPDAGNPSCIRGRWGRLCRQCDGHVLSRAEPSL